MLDRPVLVTGGAGFIGSEVVAQLVHQGAHVIVIDNLVNGRRENLEPLAGDHCRLVVGDIRDGDAVAAALRGVGVVFHLACLGVRHSIHSPRENHEVNATATLALLGLARSAGVRRFVCVSSSEVYGSARQVPMTEDHPTCPETVYGASKLAGESYAHAFFRTYGYETVVVRPFNTYGPRCHHEGDSGEVIPKFMLRCLAGRPMVVFGDGEQTRDFTHVSDTARGIVAAGLSPKTVGETINIGSGRAVSINELACEIGRVTGGPAAAVVHDAPRPGDVRHLRADIAKARALLGFEPQVDLKDGLRWLMDWYLAAGKSPDALLAQEIVRNWEPSEVEPR